MKMTRSQFLLSAMALPFGVSANTPHPGPLPADALTAPFRTALRAGDTAALAALIEADPALVNWRDERGVSALVLAAMAGHEEVVHLLHKRGAALGLMEAVIVNDSAVMNSLLEKAPGLVRECNADGWSPLHAAVATGRMQALFTLGSAAGGFDIQPESGAGITPLSLALRHPDKHLATRLAQRMLANGASPNPVQKDGITPLHHAAEAGNEYMVTMLIRKGAVVDARDVNGRTPLDAALEGGRSACAALLRAHATIARDHDRTRFIKTIDGSPWVPAETAIPYNIGNRFVGASHTNLDAVRTMLAEYPAIFRMDATWRELGIEACAHTGRRDIVEVIAAAGAPISLATAAMLGRADLVKEFIALDAAVVRERGPHDYPLLAYPALGENSLEIAEILIRAGVDVNAESSGGSGLHYAARSGKRDLAAFYLAHGADPTRRRLDDDATPKDLALKAGFAEIAGLF